MYLFGIIILYNCLVASKNIFLLYGVITGSLLLTVGERLANKHPVFSKYSVISACHELAHLRVAKLFGVKAEWKTVNHHTSADLNGVSNTIISSIYLAPIFTSTVALSFFVYISKYLENQWGSLLITSLLFLIFYAGVPSGNPEDANSDWEFSSRYGNNIMNILLIAIYAGIPSLLFIYLF